METKTFANNETMTATTPMDNEVYASMSEQEKQLMEKTLKTILANFLKKLLKSMADYFTKGKLRCFTQEYKEIEQKAKEQCERAMKQGSEASKDVPVEEQMEEETTERVFGETVPNERFDKEGFLKLSLEDAKTTCLAMIGTVANEIMDIERMNPAYGDETAINMGIIERLGKDFAFTLYDTVSQLKEFERACRQDDEELGKGNPEDVLVTKIDNEWTYIRNLEVLKAGYDSRKALPSVTTSLEKQGENYTPLPVILTVNEQSGIGTSYLTYDDYVKAHDGKEITVSELEAFIDTTPNGQGFEWTHAYENIMQSVEENGREKANRIAAEYKRQQAERIRRKRERERKEEERDGGGMFRYR